MILKGFKEKSIKKQLNTFLNQPRDGFDSKKVQTLGIILNADETIGFELLKSIGETINVRPNNIKVVAFTKESSEKTFSWNDCFNPKDFDWKGGVANPELELFLKKEFDLLISYYSQDVLELKYMTAFSKAKLKVGVFESDPRLNDLIIKTNTKDVEIFKSELYKYLKVLKKLSNE